MVAKRTEACSELLLEVSIAEQRTFLYAGFIIYACLMFRLRLTSYCLYK